MFVSTLFVLNKVIGVLQALFWVFVLLTRTGEILTPTRSQLSLRGREHSVSFHQPRPLRSDQMSQGIKCSHPRVCLERAGGLGTGICGEISGNISTMLVGHTMTKPTFATWGHSVCSNGPPRCTKNTVSRGETEFYCMHKRPHSQDLEYNTFNSSVCNSCFYTTWHLAKSSQIKLVFIVISTMYPVNSDMMQYFARFNTKTVKKEVKKSKTQYTRSDDRTIPNAKKRDDRILCNRVEVIFYLYH